MHVRYRKRAFSVLFILMLTIWPICPAYAAESDSCRAVIGADLTEEQIRNVYILFGISRGDVPELRLTNAGSKTSAGARPKCTSTRWKPWVFRMPVWW